MKLVSLPEEKTKKGFLLSGADEAEVGASLGAVLAETHEKKSRRGSQWGGSPQRAASYIAWTGNESIRFEGGNRHPWRPLASREPGGAYGQPWRCKLPQGRAHFGGSLGDASRVCVTFGIGLSASRARFHVRTELDRCFTRTMPDDAGR